ncbi:MAG: branched-chain amino acid ABC transporter substrate-binding protein [Anaerolineae bacterium]|nr:branched-chain amino acid ABC transporter substrate-binding protein [Anaerolineae bacterium]
MGWLISSCAVLGSTRPVVKIGLVAPFEGLHRHLGYDVLYAVKLAVRERNAAGGVSGHKVELVALDDSNDPAQAPLQARKMIVDTDVMGVIGHFSDETALAAVDEYHRAGLALITQVAADAVTERGYPEVFRLYARNDLLGAEAARYVVEELGMHRLAVLRGDDDLADAFLQTAELLGAAVVLDADVGGQAWLADLKAASPELVFFSGGAVEGGEVIARARGSGVEATFMGSSELDRSQLVQIGGEAVRGTLYITAAPKINVGDFVTGYQSLAGRLPGSQAIMAYDATRVLLEALARAIELQGRPVRDAVVAELSALQNYPGLIGAITFDDKGDLMTPKTYVYRFEL